MDGHMQWMNSDLFHKVDWMIDHVGFYAVIAMFQLFNRAYVVF